VKSVVSASQAHDEAVRRRFFGEKAAHFRRFYQNRRQASQTKTAPSACADSQDVSIVRQQLPATLTTFAATRNSEFM
jgi:hypothetical protein